MNGLNKQIKRLRLQDGDILVVRNHEDLEALITAKPNLPKHWSIPIVVVQGSIHTLSADYLRRLLIKKENGRGESKHA